MRSCVWASRGRRSSQYLRPIGKEAAVFAPAPRTGLASFGGVPPRGEWSTVHKSLLGRFRILTLIAVAALFAGFVSATGAQAAQVSKAAEHHLLVGHSAKNDTSPKRRNMRPKPMKAPKHPVPVLRLPNKHKNVSNALIQAKGAVQNHLALPRMPATQ